MYHTSNDNDVKRCPRVNIKTSCCRSRGRLSSAGQGVFPRGRTATAHMLLWSTHPCLVFECRPVVVLLLVVVVAVAVVVVVVVLPR